MMTAGWGNSHSAVLFWGPIMTTEEFLALAELEGKVRGMTPSERVVRGALGAGYKSRSTWRDWSCWYWYFLILFIAGAWSRTWVVIIAALLCYIIGLLRNEEMPG